MSGTRAGNEAGRTRPDAWRLAAAACVLAFAGCAAVPEVGVLTDRGGGRRKIVVRLDEQKAFLYRDEEVVAVSPVSSGRKGHGTPAGRFRVTEKDIDHRSSIYGAYVRDGRIVEPDVDRRKDPRPAGATFVGAAMPYFMRINGPIGMHGGHVPGYPASHGCIRLPRRHAVRFYHAVEVGTPVIVSR